MSTLLFFFVLVAQGLWVAMEWIASRWPNFIPAKVVGILTVVALIAIQIALNYRQLPQYGG